MKVAEGSEDPEEVLVIKKILEKAREGDTQVLKLLWNYLDGLPTQRIEGDLKVGNYDWGKYDNNLQSEDMDEATPREPEEMEGSSST